MTRLPLLSALFASSLAFACASVTDEDLSGADGMAGAGTGGGLAATGGGSATGGGFATGGTSTGGGSSTGGVFGVSGGTTGAGGTSSGGGSATGGASSGGSASGGAGTGGSVSTGDCGSLPEWVAGQCFQASGGVTKGSEIQYNGKKFTFDGNENTDKIYDCNAECPPEGGRAAWCAGSQYTYTLVGPC